MPAIAAADAQLDGAQRQSTGVMESLLAQEVARLQAKRQDIDRELGVLQALRRDVSVSMPVR